VLDATPLSVIIKTKVFKQKFLSKIKMENENFSLRCKKHQMEKEAILTPMQLTNGKVVSPARVPQ